MPNIPSLELQTFTDEPLAIFEVKVWRQPWLDKLLRKPTSRTFTIYRARVCNMGRSAALANEMELSGNIDSLESLVQVTLPLIHANRIKVLRLIACCIQNNDKEPASSLIKFLDANLNADMLNEILAVCLWNLGLQSFLSAIISIKGTSANFVSDTDAEPVSTRESQSLIP